MKKATPSPATSVLTNTRRIGFSEHTADDLPICAYRSALHARNMLCRVYKVKKKPAGQIAATVSDNEKTKSL